MLYKSRERFEKLSISIGIAFARFGITPNQWTLLSLLPAVASAYYIAQEQFLLAAALFAVAAVLDFVDGSVARVTGRATRFGAYLDTVVDRYVEALVVLGLVFAALPALVVQAEAWIVAYLFGAMMTTYAKSAASEKKLVEAELRGGLLERAERLILLFAGVVGAAFVGKGLLTAVVALLAVLANITALQRIWIARKEGRVYQK